MNARIGCVLAAAALVLGLGSPSSAGASSLPGGMITPAPIDPWLARQLDSGGEAELTVLVHGTELAAARRAVSLAGLTPRQDLGRIGVAIASGTPREVRLAAYQPGVTYLEGDRPLAYFTDYSHVATRGVSAARFRDSAGKRLDGSGVSVAVIDTGVDATHPFLTRRDGKRVVVANLKNVCGVVVSSRDTCFVDLGPRMDTDSVSVGGHGTHVIGIVAGQPTKLTDGSVVRGAAPGARIVSLSVGLGISIVNADQAMHWVLEHHRHPCGPDVPAVSCPPIKVVNNSWGPAGGGAFDPRSALTKLQRRLAARGVVTVWANGNDGGDGSANHSNPPGQDPTGGIISVASYFDHGTGTRRGAVSGFSSRGRRSSPATWPDISAPGEDITSACRPYLWVCAAGFDARSGTGASQLGAFNTISGTSMAAPHIAGTVALLLQAKRRATPAQLERVLLATAYRYPNGAKYRDIGRRVSSYDKGVGLVDAAAAVRRLVG